MERTILSWYNYLLRLQSKDQMCKMNETMAKVTNITEATSGREEDVRLLMMSSTLLTFITLLDIV